MVIERYIHNIEEAKIKELILASDILIQSLVPQVILETKWRLPFYSYLGPLLYFNVSKGKFYFGFYHGNKMNHITELEHSLKMVSKLYISSIEDLNNPRVSEIIVEATMLNEAKINERKKG